MKTNYTTSSAQNTQTLDVREVHSEVVNTPSVETIIIGKTVLNMR